MHKMKTDKRKRKWQEQNPDEDPTLIDKHLYRRILQIVLGRISRPKKESLHNPTGQQRIKTD